jgi:hypothetical protein
MLQHTEHHRPKAKLVLDPPFGKTRSVRNDFNQLVLNLISRHTDFVQHFEDIVRSAGLDEANVLEVVNVNRRPWTIHGT